MVTCLICNTKWQGNPAKSADTPSLLLRHRILNIIGILLLAGCATDFRDTLTQREILQPWTEISSVQTGLLPQGLPAQPNLPPKADYITLRRPSAISARGNDIYLLDAGLRRLFRYDSFQKTLMPFAATLPAEAGMSIYAAPDMSVYVTDPAHEQVLHFNWDGTPLPSLISRGNLARPVSVVVDERHGQVLVADGLFNRIVAFDNLGTVIAVFKPLQVLAIAAMATGPDGIYVVDRLAKRIVVLGWNGTFHYAFGADALSEPGTIAVSRDNLVFISDNFDHTIRVYRKQGTKDIPLVLADKIGGAGIAPGSFNRIGGMAVADDMLYVSDSLNARVQVMLINPRARGTGK